ncbi:MAG: response regulator [Lachnospiraceae bacterium]
MDIAVMDDEKVIREHICRLVEEQKPESRVEAYATGERLSALGKCFDIVFLDIQMEGMEGIKAARSLREKQGDTVHRCELKQTILVKLLYGTHHSGFFGTVFSLPGNVNNFYL